VIILFSGPISVGKSTVSDLLVSEHGFKRIRTSDYLRSQIALADKQPNRTELQNCGDELDIKTNYMWVIDDVLIPAMSQFPDQENWLFDSVRKPEQVTNFKSKFGLKVKHIHLIASEDIIKERYSSRQSFDPDNDVSYEVAVSHENEQISRGLITQADYVIQVDKLTPEEIAKEIISHFS
jgi:adenylate kinase family enzyme